MAGNTIGQLFRVTTFGESHGLALGCIVDGVPPGIPLTEADLQHDLDRRRPGTSRYTTQRREPDQVKILSGVFEGVMRITPTSRNMACAIIAAAVVRLRVKPRCAWRPGRLPKNSSRPNSVL